jgi:predicted DNA-binding WGR domain protein
MERRTLLTHTDSGHNKFYEITLISDLRDGLSHSVKVRYGKIGLNGRTITKAIGVSWISANKMVHDLINKKLMKGYRVRGDVNSISPTEPDESSGLSVDMEIMLDLYE